MNVPEAAFHQEAVLMLILGSPANGVSQPLKVDPRVRLIAHGVRQGNEKVQVPCSAQLALPASDKRQNTQGEQGRAKGIKAPGCLFLFSYVLGKCQGQFSAIVFTPLTGESLDIFLDGKSLFGPVRSKLIRIRV